MKQGKLALHSGWSSSCVMGHNEMEVTRLQHCFSQGGIWGIT